MNVNFQQRVGNFDLNDYNLYLTSGSNENEFHLNYRNFQN